MIRRIATVGGLTLASRVTGFMRNVVMAAVLGAGPVGDAFFVAFRLPNHFRAIFAEGAFDAAFVPAYSRTLLQAGLPAARLFSDRIAAALLGDTRRGAGLHTLGSEPACARARPRPAALRSRGDAYTHHLSRSTSRVDADHDLRRTE